MKRNNTSMDARDAAATDKKALFGIGLSTVSIMAVVVLAFAFFTKNDSSCDGNTRLIVAILVVAICLLCVLLVISARIILHKRCVLLEQIQENDAIIEQSDKNLLRYDIVNRTLYNLNGSNVELGVERVIENYPDSILETDLIAPESREDLRNLYTDMRAGIPSGSAIIRLKNIRGEYRWHHIDYKLLFDSKGASVTGIISYYDNTVEREKELAYEIRRSELMQLVQTSVFYIEANLTTGNIEHTQGCADKARQYKDVKNSLRELAGKYAKTNIIPDDAKAFGDFFDRNRLIVLFSQGVFVDSIEFRAMNGDEAVWNRATIQMVKYPYSDDIKLYAIFNDITAERREQERLIRMASTDSLTGC